MPTNSDKDMTKIINKGVKGDTDRQAIISQRNNNCHEVGTISTTILRNHRKFIQRLNDNAYGIHLLRPFKHKCLSMYNQTC